MNELLSPEIRERLHIRLSSVHEEQDVEPNGLDILFHLFSTASFEDKFWSGSDEGPKELSEEDTMYTFFNRLAKSGLLPDKAECLLYVCVFPFSGMI